MSTALTLCLASLILLATIGAPISLAMIASAVVYLAVKGQDLGLAAEQIIQGLYDNFVLLAVPLFIVSANFMNAGTISDRLTNWCVALVGRLRGGLGHVNVVTSIIFAGMSGSAVADVVGLGNVSINMMIKNNRYTPGYAAAITAATAVIGPIIPPSIPMVLYSLVSNASIGYLFLGGIVPGLLMAAAMMALNTYCAHRDNVPIEAGVPMRELPRLTFDALPALLMPVILLGCIYSGVATPTEAAAIAAAYAFLVAAFYYRALSLRDVYTVMRDSSRASASVGLIIGSALIFNYIVASENIPNQVSAFLKSQDISALQFLIGVNVLFLILGCLLDASTIILVIIPILLPTCRALGIDLVYFGILAVVNCMIGLITPPYGILLFVINATTGIPLRTIITAIWPWVGVLVACLVLMIIFPDIILFVPKMFGYVPGSV
jgi:tripartite ATP-independent transporter DctM subunit